MSHSRRTAKLPGPETSIVTLPRPASLAGDQRPGQQLALAAGQPPRLGDRAIERYRAARLYGQAVVAGGAVDVVQRQRQAAAVVGREEARQHGVGGDGVAHEHPLVGRADARPGVGHGHDPQLADEVGHLQRDPRLALVVELHRAAEQRHGAGRHDVEPADLAGVAADPDAAEIVGPGLEQAAVVVAHLEAEPPLAEVVRGRVGGAEACQLQDALVDRCHRHPGFLAAEVADLDR